MVEISEDDVTIANGNETIESLLANDESVPAAVPMVTSQAF